jgi:metallo-beta-lactamase family protein
VTLFGELIDVRCEVAELHGISGHADQTGLVKWLTSFKKEPKLAFINHGDKDVAPWFASFVSKTLGIRAYAPEILQHFNLLDEASFPAAEMVEDAATAYLRELSEAVALLKQEEKTLLSVVKRLEAAGKERDIDEKRAVRLTNAINRLASDLEYLQIKWGGDPD